MNLYLGDVKSPAWRYTCVVGSIHLVVGDLYGYSWLSGSNGVVPRRKHKSRLIRIVHNFVLGPPPPGVPGEGPDCQFPVGIRDLRQIPARIRRVMYFCFCLALIAPRLSDGSFYLPRRPADIRPQSTEPPQLSIRTLGCWAIVLVPYVMQ